MTAATVHREVDALIAKHVFGYWDVGEFEGRLVHGENTINGWPVNTPHYSTDMTAAMLVVEALARRTPDPWMLSLKNWNYYGDRTYSARFRTHPLGPPSVRVEAETAPLAICRAALALFSVAL